MQSHRAQETRKLVSRNKTNKPRDTLEIGVVEEHHPSRCATKSSTPPHCQFLASKLQNDIIRATLNDVIHCTPTHTLF